jgi:hypothetical protein
MDALLDGTVAATNIVSSWLLTKVQSALEKLVGKAFSAKKTIVLNSNQACRAQSQH